MLVLSPQHNKALLPDNFPLRSKFAAERGVQVQEMSWWK
jgi:hypothetical protein